MSHAGHIYGVVLNDTEERAKLAASFEQKPYLAAPCAPVVFIKPATAIASHSVQIAPGAQVVASTTFALWIRHETCRIDPAQAWDHIGASALAIDLSYPKDDYYRPAVAFRNADGFLGLGEWRQPSAASHISLECDGHEIHRWSLERLLRPVDRLLADLSAFMTLRAGDLLLVGLPGDAPMVAAGHTISAHSPGFSPASLQLEYSA